MDNMKDILDLCAKHNIPNIQNIEDLERKTTIGISVRTLLLLREVGICGENPELTIKRILTEHQQHNNGGE